jgi:hypothetical protein
MHPSQVLDKQADMLARINNFHMKRMFTASEGQVATRSAWEGPDGQVVTDTHYSPSAGLFETIHRLLGIQLPAADAFFVSENMVDVMMQRALDTLPDDTQLSEVPPPRQIGFAYLESPITLYASRGKQILVHAITWGPASTIGGTPGWIISRWNDSRRQPDEAYQEMVENVNPVTLKEFYDETGGWNLIGVAFVPKDMRVGPALIEMTRWSKDDGGWQTTSGFNPSETSLVNMSMCSPEPPADGVQQDEWLEHEGAEYFNEIRIIAALWQLMDETISEWHDEPLKRADRRRAMHNKIKPRVTVIKLRRIVNGFIGAPGTGHPLTLRVPVSGHWRLQPYGPGRNFVHRIWIKEHERGPVDAPYSMSRKVNHLAR